MSELVLPGPGTLELPTHGPGRALGQKRKAQLRLALGYRDETRRGAPVKTDYFIPHGDDRIVSKFLAEYGDRPQAVAIRLPGSLPGFLDLRHVAFAGGQGGQGGYLRAIGATNFAAAGRLGGPDTLTVYEKVGEGRDARLEVSEVPIAGVDDPAARRLDVYLQCVVSFGIPNVLGLGGLCQVATRGSESIDTLYESAADIYGQLGSYASIALRPFLVLKASTMLTPTGSRAPVFVLDLDLPESLDEVYLRLERHHQLVPARGHVAAELLYGSERLALGEGSEGDPAAAETPPEARDGQRPTTAPTAPADGEASSPSGNVSAPVTVRSEPGPGGPPTLPGPGTPDDEPLEGDIVDEPQTSLLGGGDPDAAYRRDLDSAGDRAFPTGKHKGKTLHELAETEDGRGYLKWAADNWKSPEDFAMALRFYAQGLE